MTTIRRNIPRWNPSAIKGDETCLVVGKRNAGKTTLLIDVMSSMVGILDVCIGMNPTENPTKPVLGRFLPPAFIFDRYDEKKINHILEWQRRSVANEKGMKTGLILDDCMGEVGGDGKKTKVMSQGNIGKIFKIGRHLKIFFWCTLQYMRDAPPDARGNTDLLFLYNLTSHLERRKCYEDFFGTVKTFDEFESILSSCTRGYKCLVLDTRIAMRDPDNCLFWYEANNAVPAFRLGRESFWTLSHHYFVDNTDNDMDVTRCMGIDPAKTHALHEGKRGKKHIVELEE